MESTTYSTTSESFNEATADQINGEMRNAVLPITVFVGLLSVLGFFGNLLVLYIFLFHYRNCNFRYFVLCLALTDITSCLTTMPGEIVTQLFWYVYPSSMVCKIKSFFNMFTVISEALCLVTMAVDRYRKICKPFAWQIKHKIARILCFGIFFLAFIIAFPVPILWGTHEEIIPFRNVNVTVVVCEKDQKFVDTNGPLTYTIVIETCVSISLVVMFVIYIVIGHRLHLVRRVKRRNSVRRPTTACSETEISSTASEMNMSLKTDAKVNTSTTNASENSLKDDNKQKELTQKLETGLKEFRDIKNETNTTSNPRLSQSNSERIAAVINEKIKRKALIMFVLTIVFIVTTILYLTLLSFIANGVLPSLSDSQRAVYFFFFRLYFINHVINPVVYGVLDPHFRKTMLRLKDWIRTAACKRG